MTIKLTFFKAKVNKEMFLNENVIIIEHMCSLLVMLTTWCFARYTQGLPPIVNSIVSTTLTCNLDKDIKDLPNLETFDAKNVDLAQHNDITGKVYSQIMQIESRLCLIIPPPSRPRLSSRLPSR